MYSWIRPWLFRLDPEQAHNLTLRLLQLAGGGSLTRWLLRKMYTVPGQAVQVFGLTFQNPIGLAAGYDKDGLAWRGLACLGFGHIEVGTVTLLPQPGNPRPRLFRLVEDRSVINRMGFPGRGAEYVMRRLLAQRPPGLVLGVNIGKNKDTPLAEAGKEYAALVRLFAPLADYLVINVSSPNTVGLRRLQARQSLEELLSEVSSARQEARLTLPIKPIPVLVKLAPDLTFAELEDALEAVQSAGMDGIIVANTTLERDNLLSPHSHQAGGLSGAALHRRSLKMVSQVASLCEDRLPVVGVGGVMDAQSAQAMLDAGAVLVQVYTGLVYAGPGLVRQILLGLQKTSA